MMWMLLLAGIHWIAALGIVFVCMASPGHLYPLQSIVISGMLAVVVGVLGLKALRRPKLTVSFPVLITFGGTAVGLYNINQELQAIPSPLMAVKIEIYQNEWR